MKLKLDENLGSRGIELLRQAGHDVSTVAVQGLSSGADRQVIQVSAAGGRCLVTLDLDFANPLIFKPSDYAGIAVLRLPPSAAPSDLHDASRTLIGGLARSQIMGRLWVIQRGRIREYQPDEHS